MTLKIALSGKARSGKDTTAKLISDLLKPQAQAILAAAAPLKDTIKIWMPWLPNLYLNGDSQYRDQPLDQIISSTHGKYDSTRDVAKLIAKVMKEELNPEIILQILTWKLRGLEDEFAELTSSLIVFSDLRFPEELTWARQNGFICWRIIRSNLIGLPVKTTSDVSETLQDTLPNSVFDAVIDNSGDKNNLKKQIINLLPYKGNNLSLPYANYE